jgi:hypothetical protein
MRHHGAVGQPIYFLAGESAERSWRDVAALLPFDATILDHELLGRAGGPPGHSWQAEVDALALPADRASHLVGALRRGDARTRLPGGPRRPWPA